MKSTRLVALLAACLYVSAAWTADSNSYQVTGTILSLTPTVITVQKDNEKWELARDQKTPVRGGDLKVGSKVTVNYRMTAISVEVKSDKK